MSRKGSRDTNLETTGDEIAIIGIGCRFPGASCLREFWQVLVNGENHVVEITDERWNSDAYYDKDPRTPGKSYAPRAGFIKNYAHFDFKMFGMNEHEAAQMDPQQRQVLECTYMALEDAGITRQQIAGQKVGVFLGCMNNDFTQLANKHPHLVDNFTVTGTGNSIVSNRVSYAFDLRGPSMTIDTACSSSLVAIHQAGLAMKEGDCSMAICGGVNLLLSGGVFVPLSKAQMLSPTGQCHAFSANADGYTRGEGCGIVIIKPFKQALEDGDNIWGTLVTGLNQDGHVAKPLTAPSGEQQAQLIQDVYTKHGIDPASIDYIEAHGTGTKIGDPTEVSAFGHFFLQQQQSKRRYIGSVKTNIGHLEAAAGVAGLIKVLLMMKHSTIVPSLHFDKPNEEIDFDRFQFDVPTKTVPWLPDQKVACLNSFGFGGANSHALVKCISNRQINSTYSCTKPIVICFSGSNHQTLTKSIEQFLSIENHDYDIHALSYTSCVRREHFQCRKLFVVSDMSSLVVQLTDFIKTDSRAEPKKGQLRPVFVFCGMGTAWKGMCVDLMEQNKGFRGTMESIGVSLKRFVGWSLTQRLKEDDVSDPVLGPIAIFACQVSLAHLWESWGVKPAAVVGQSVGEVAAAHIAGILSLDEAVRVIYQRTKILSRAAGGKMLLVKNMDTKEVENHCEKYEGKISVGLYYSPKACTVSGDASAVDQLKVELSEIDGDMKLIDLQVTTAFHSHHMDPYKEEIDAVLQNLKTQHPTVPFISTVDSNYTEVDIRAATYWAKNVREPVKFGDGIQAAMKENAHNVFIEIGPRPVLKAHIEDILQGTSQTADTVPSMTPNSKYENLLKSLGELYAWNCNICWSELCEMSRFTTAEPTHAFEHKHVMAFPNETEDSSQGASVAMNHLFMIQVARDTRLKMHIDPSSFGSIYEHKIKDVIIIPGATYAETGFGITSLLKLSNPYASTVSVVFQNPFILKKGFPADMSVDVTPSDSCTHFQVRGNDIVHAQGKIDHRKEQPTEERVDMARILKRCSENISREDIYQNLSHLGFSYGDNFATIDYACTGQEEALVKMKIPQMLRKEMDHTFLHPAILDGMLQAAAATSTEIDKQFFPVQLKDVHLNQALETEMFTYTQRLHSTERYHSFHMKLLSENGRVLAEVGVFKIKIIGTDIYDVIVPTWKRLDQTFKEDPLNTKIAVFTDTRVCVNDNTQVVFNMDVLTTDWMKNELESAIEGVSKVCFLFPTIEVSTDNGYTIQEELIKRFLSLRLIVLYLTNKRAETPLIIMSEATEAKSATDAAAATACLNDAMTAMVRCIIREHRTLIIQLVEVVVGTSGELMKNMKHFLARLLAIPPTKYPEIRLQNDSIHTSSMQLISEEAPNYRTSSIHDPADALLCSAIDSKLVEPSFVQDTDTKHYIEKDAMDISVASAVLHKQCLHSITANNQHFRDIRMYPILCFEFVGRVASRNGSVQPQIAALFPSPIKLTVSLPKRCTINIAKFQCYQPGLLIKLYCLWNLSHVVKLKHVAILFSSATEALSKVLSDMLQCNGTKSVALITPEEMATDENCSHRSLITTLAISTDILTNLVSKWSQLETVITFETINKERTLQFLRSGKSSPTVYIVRPFDIFSPSAMLENVPKLIAWIEKHQKKIPDLFESHTREFSPQDDCTLLSIAELVQTTCLDLSEEDGLDMKVMRTQINNPFHRRGSYIVVGGRTGLGWECVSYLAKGGAGCIVILSRSAPDPEKQEQVQFLREKFCCVVTFIQTDVSDFKALESALATLKAKFSEYPLRGIFYGAAVIDDSPLIDMTEEKVRKVVSPKVTGVWNMHLLTAHLCLDFFVMHSSVVSGIGNAGQSNYGAGNGFLDGLAHLRRRFELNGQSINWGPLDTGILQHSTKYVRDRLREKGLLVIEKQDISSCLEQTLMLNKVQMFVINVDRKGMAKQLMRDKEKIVMIRLHDYLESFFNQPEDGPCEQQLDLAELSLLGTENRMNRLQSYLRTLVCKKALLEEISFEDEVPLVQQGLDSMYAMEVAGQIHADTRVEITASDILVKPVSVLASMINESLFNVTDTEVYTEEHENVISQTDILDSIERNVLEEEQQSLNKSGFIYTRVLSLPDVLDTSQMFDVANECLSRHHIARTTFAFLNGDVKREESKSPDGLQIVTGESATKIVSKAHDLLDLEKTGPIKFIFLSDTSELVLLFHRVAFDFKGVMLLEEEFRRFGDALLHGQLLSDVKTNPDRNIAKEIQRVLAPLYENLEAFWKSTLHVIPYTTLSISPNAYSREYGSSILIGRRMDDATNDCLLRFTTSRNSTPFDFMISVYQLMVAFIGNTNSPSILIPVDLRQYVPSLVRCVGRCTNYIPVIADTSDLGSTTVEMFLNENKKRLRECKKNGLFLYKNIKALLSGENSKNMHTNQFVYEDQTLNEDFDDKEGESHLTFAPAAETYVFVYNKKDNSKYIELHLRSDMFPLPRGKWIMQTFLRLVSYVANHPEWTLQHLKQQVERKMKVSNVCSLL